VSARERFHDPRTWRRLHAGLVLFWLALIPPTVIWWRDSVAWVALLSIYANVAGHFGSWQAARAEGAVTDG
jgi:hypothetical protein